MVDNWVTFFVDFFGSLFSFLSNWELVPGINMLAFIIASLLMCLLLGTFLSKGRS